MKTPLYIDYESIYPNYLSSNYLNLYQDDPINIYVNPTILDSSDITNTLPYLLAPRYYLIIHHPPNNPGPHIHIPLHKSPNSLLNNKLRILLSPSVGWGINASYKVDYWEWVPNINLPALPSKRKLYTEYWYIPTLDSHYTPHFPFDLRLNQWYPHTCPDFYTNSLRTSISLTVQRTIIDDIVSDLITDVNGSNVFCFPLNSFISFSENIITENLLFNEETLAWTFSKALIGSTLVRDVSQVDGDLLDATVQTTIDYIKPLSLQQVQLKDCDDILNNDLVHTF